MNHISASILRSFAPYLLLAACIAPTFAWLVQNNKYGYAYYNAFAGNVQGRYDQDHLFTAVSRAFEWLRRHELTDTSRQYVVATISFGLGDYQASKQYPNITLIPIDELNFTKKNCDYAILHTKTINYTTLKNWWTPAGTIHTENINGIPVCAVVKKNPDEAAGVRFLQNGIYDSALLYLQSAYSIAPHTLDLPHWFGLAHYNLGHYEDASAFFTKDVHIMNRQAPLYGVVVKQDDALFYLGLSKMALQKYDEAIDAFRAIEHANRRRGYAMPVIAAANLGKCLYNKGRYAAAVPYLEMSVGEYPYLHEILSECRARK
jgi:tetratricopeptide (TPR) repeat protein